MLLVIEFMPGGPCSAAVNTTYYTSSFVTMFALELSTTIVFASTEEIIVCIILLLLCQLLFDLV
jgi:hypothetical protein